MTVTTTNPGPYAPSSAILELVQRYRNRGLSKPFTAEVLARAGVSDSLIPRTLQSLQTLDLMDSDGNPTETLEALRRASEPDFKKQMAAWVRAVYADVLAFVEPTDDETKLRDAFRSYNPVGQQPRMVALFVGLCRAAGLRPDETESRSRPHARKPISGAPVRQVGKRQREADVRAAPFMALPSPLRGLLESLPVSGEWTKAERDKFVATFSTVLDFCIPITSSKKKTEEVADE